MVKASILVYVPEADKLRVFQINCEDMEDALTEVRRISKLGGLTRLGENWLENGFEFYPIHRIMEMDCVANPDHRSLIET